jgi:cytoskeleton protein RodZ
MSERADQPATPEFQHGTPGRALAAQREAMGWTVEQVADQLKLAVRQVVALEAGDYAALPSAAVVRGFVRAYAKILRLDAAPLVAMIELETPPPADISANVRPQKPATFSESSRFPLHGKRSGLPLGWIAVGVIVVAGAAAAWHFGLVRPLGEEGGAAASSPAPAAAGARPDAASEPLQNPNVPLITVPGEATTPPAGEAQPANAGAAPAGAAPAAPAAKGGPAAELQAVPPAPPGAALQPVQAATATAVGPNALVLDVREDSWVQVRTANGKNLLSRLVKGGSTETVTVDQPVTMIVGNPKGVSANLRGAAVELPMLPGKTIARVSLK